MFLRRKKEQYEIIPKPQEVPPLEISAPKPKPKETMAEFEEEIGVKEEEEKRAPPIYVELKNYEDLKEIIRSMREPLASIRSTLREMAEIYKKKQITLTAWKDTLASIESLVDELNSSLIRISKRDVPEEFPVFVRIDEFRDIRKDINDLEKFLDKLRKEALSLATLCEDERDRIEGWQEKIDTLEEYMLEMKEKTKMKSEDTEENKKTKREKSENMESAIERLERELKELYEQAKMLEKSLDKQ